ncbi:glycosyltransferase [Aliivibrio finisterrensis]|uniref:Glycosyltransferase n=1 Tax=Aliivibrio finisterrensis TaxID=511998 RepID=A0A6N6RNW6_9GAMM|nr:glycosyltransferase [Aliivibrio finisterrensis]KAB2823165.1 glycosyltransferase [Aliivibrio finisterrensis]
MNKIMMANLSYEQHYGGVENSIRYLTQAFCEDGLQVYVLSGSYRSSTGVKQMNDFTKINFFFPGYSNFFFKIISMPVSIISMLYYLFYAKYILGVDFVISRNQFVGTFASLVFRRKSVFLAPGFNHRQSDSENLIEGSNIFQRLERRAHGMFDYLCVRFSGRVFVFSLNMKKQLQEVLNIFNSNYQPDVMLCKPGVDKSLFKPIGSLSMKMSLRQELGIPQYDKIILCVGRCVKAKGFDLAVSSFSSSNLLGFTLVIIGDGPELPMLKELAVKHKCTKVLFLGKQDNLHKYYQTSDFFFMSSRYEPLGQTILEAIGCGLPVLALGGPTVLTATQELLGSDGALYSKDNSQESIIELLESLLTLTDSQWSDISFQSFTKAKSFSWNNLSRKLVSGE